MKVTRPRRWVTNDRSLQELEVIQVLRQVPGCPFKFCAYGGKRHGVIDLSKKSLTVYKNSGRPTEANTAPPCVGCSLER